MKLKFLVAALAVLLFSFCAMAEEPQREVTLADYLAEASQQWFVTGKTDYEVDGVMLSGEFKFHNPFEVTDYDVTDDGVSVVLKGTTGEMWVSKLSKVMKTYTLVDGSPVAEDTFAQRDVWVTLRTISALGTNLAMYVPLDVSVTVETAWGDVLHTNLNNAPHGMGDFLICRPDAEGNPDLSDVWVVNGATFPTTYDLSNLSGIVLVEK